MAGYYRLKDRGEPWCATAHQLMVFDNFYHSFAGLRHEGSNQPARRRSPGDQLGASR